MERNRIIIIGGSACGPKAAARARRCDPNALITVVEQSAYVSTATCGLPYYVAGVIKRESSLSVRGPDYFKNVFNVNVITGTRALSIDRSRKTVEAVNLKTGVGLNLEYDHLVLATGSKPVVPDMPGVGLRGIFTLSGIDDANAIKKRISRNVRKAVIIGSGLVGMEMAEALVLKGLDVTVIESLNWLMPAILDFEMAAYLEKHIRRPCLNIVFGQRVSGFEGSNGRVRQVIMESGKLAADLVLIAIGRRPNTQLAAEAGLPIGRTSGIEVNEFLQTSDPAIYAGGDCVENVHLVTGKKVLAPLGSTANKHGRVIGRNITGGRDTFPGIAGTSIAKIFEYTVGRTGLTEQEAAKQGYSPITSLTPGQEHARYYPGARDIIIKIIADKSSRRVLGGEIVGWGGVDKRIDVLATALAFNATVDHLANIDLGYAPPYNSALDPLHNAANIIRNKLSGLARSISPMEVKEKLDRGEDFLVLDVRSEAEWNANRIEAPQVKLIPLDTLRQNLDKIDKDKEIVTICQASVRAYQAQRILDGAGFKNVKFMDGSMGAWPYQSTGFKLEYHKKQA